MALGLVLLLCLGLARRAQLHRPLKLPWWETHDVQKLHACGLVLTSCHSSSLKWCWPAGWHWAGMVGARLHAMKGGRAAAQALSAALLLMPSQLQPAWRWATRHSAPPGALANRRDAVASTG